MKTVYTLKEQCKWSVNNPRIPGPFRYVDIEIVRDDGSVFKSDTLELPEQEAILLCDRMRDKSLPSGATFRLAQNMLTAASLREDSWDGSQYRLSPRQAADSACGKDVGTAVVVTLLLSDWNQAHAWAKTILGDNPPKADKACAWLHLTDDCMIASRCDWMYRTTGDGDVERDETRHRILGGRDGDIVIAHLDSATGWQDLADLRIMLSTLDQ
jgi:hypothetical protein